jgi:uncharacterized protein (DUF58 family)
MPPPTSDASPTTAFFRRHADAIICLGATLAIVVAPAGLPIWVIVAVVVAICFAYQAWRFTRLLTARVEMLEEEAEQQGVYVSSLLETATKPETTRVVAVVRDLPRNTRTAKEVN